ncbi:peptide deformylase [Olsenella profusa]|uniref:Peptide deformylase n=1 Tax=Olsenella profusa TaxID=138595 RepID=A0ABS2F1B4_9ACTN|nr:peptide deformylase [Olsenella profusa]MBM6774357.1 peptide deformylase [Olsenella profusa]
MIKDLVKDEAILSTPCEPATAEDAEVVTDLVDTLASIDDAVCLAANQIGVTKAIIAYQDDNDQIHVMLNPKILMGLGGAKVMENCLTHEEDTRVTRFAKIKVSFDELVDGQLKSRRRDYMGWTAQMIQHMVDHCKGKLI